MKSYHLLLLLSIFAIISPTLTAQYTKQQATNLVINQVLSESLSKIDVYVLEDTLPTETPIILAYGDSISIPYPSAWVYFVDDGPFMNWLHPCRYVFVCDSTGDYSITEKEYYPLNWDSTYTSVSMMLRPTPISLQADTTITVEEVDPDPNKYAVLICQEDKQRFWNNTSAIYCALINAYGYKKENIFVHYAHGYSAIPNGGSFYLCQQLEYMVRIRFLLPAS